MRGSGYLRNSVPLFKGRRGSSMLIAKWQACNIKTVIPKTLFFFFFLKILIPIICAFSFKHGCKFLGGKVQARS